MAAVVAVRAVSRLMESRNLRFFSTSSLPEAYPLAMKLTHWAVGGGVIGCFGTVQAAMYTTKDYQPIPGMGKGELMGLHKSFGLLVGAAVVPRVLLRLASTLPPELPGRALEHILAKAGHYALYAGMLFMPASGIAMGYYGGKGLPFFGYHIPGATPDKKNPKIAGNAFKAHKLVGQGFEIVTLGHFGAVGWHMLKGQAIWRRIIPGMS